MSFTKIWSYYFVQIRKYRISFFSLFVVYGAGILFSQGAIPLLYRKIIDTTSTATDRFLVAPELWNLIGFLAIAFILMNILFRAGDFLLTYCQSYILRDLANDAFDRVERHSYQFFSNQFTGALVAKAKRYVNAFENIHDQIVFAFWFGGVDILVIIGVLYFISPILSLILSVWVVVFVLITIALTNFQKKYNERSAAADSKVTGRFADVFTNILTVKMFSSRSREITAFQGITNEQEQARRAAWMFGNYIMLFQGVFMGVLEVGGMYLALRLWVAGAITTGTVVILQLYFGSIFKSLWHLGKSMSRFTRSLSDASEMVEIFETDIVLADPKDPKHIENPQGAITFTNAAFKYGEDSNAVFRSFNLTIRDGERVGFVGRSGAGKSTITKLILRFVDVQSGTVAIDGVDVRNLTQDDLRNLVAYVPQDPILFHRSLRENIAYGKPDATDEDVFEAARKAHAHDFITLLPKGYETLVGERGVKLSGGERQRIAIARAILKNSPILILDEATSSLDSTSEGHIQEALNELMKGRTTLVIAHRLSTIQKMDRIVVLEGGEVVEEGNHQALLSKKGVYHTLWTHQSSGFIAE